MYAYLLALSLAYPNYSVGTAMQIEAWDRGYEARWTQKLPPSANPYLPGTWQWETWNDSYKYNGWMPDLKEFWEETN